MRRVFLTVIIVTPLAAAQAPAQSRPPAAPSSTAGVPSLSARSSASFRPSPLRGESQIPGRSLSLREKMNQNRIYLMSPADSPVPSIAAARQRSAQSMARIRATQAQSSRLAAQSLRQASIATRAPRQASHVLQLAIDPVEPSPKFEDLQSRGRERRMANLRDRLGIPNVQVEIVDARAILTGVVENERRKRLLERILLLEPDIDAVDNRLTVVAP